MNDLMSAVCPFCTQPEPLFKDAYRICIPFDGNIYTTSFLLLTENGTIVFDSGDNAEDAGQYIIPALTELNRKPDYIVCSHLHQDHCGGIEALMQTYPQAKVVLYAREPPYPSDRVLLFADANLLLDRYRLCHLPGHTADCLGILDEKTHTLFSADCLQQYGITRFPTSVNEKDAYAATLAKVRNMELNSIIAAHNYVPCGFRADGAKAIKIMLDSCI